MTLQQFKTNPLYRYLFLTFAISWPVWYFKFFLIQGDWLDSQNLVALILHKIGNFGPSIAAIIVLKKPLKEMLRLVFSPGYRGSWPYLLVFMGMLTLTQFLATSGQLAVGVNPFFQALIFLAASFLGAGIAEEVGWRGVLQPALEKKFSFPLAMVFVGLIWAIWHLPLMLGNLAVFPKFLGDCILYSFWFAGLYKKTNSVLYCMLLHGFINAGTSALFVREGRNEGIILAGFLIMALYGAALCYQADRQN